MPESDFRLRELERRIGRVEDATAAVPVMQRDIASIHEDGQEAREEVRSLRRALYTTALSVVGGSVMMVISVLEVFGK